MPPPTANDDTPHAPFMCLIHALSLEMARIPIGLLMMDVDEAVRELWTDAIADLVESQWISDWADAHGDPGVILTAWAAERFGLRLTTDSARWAPIDEYREWARVKTGRVITEADLTSELDVPLSESTYDGVEARVSRRDPGDGARHRPERREPGLVSLGAMLATPEGRRVSDKQLLAIFAEAIGFTAWSCGTQLPPGHVVLCGVHPWPQPGQERGPQAPEASPSEFELGVGKGTPYVGACFTCGGLKLGPRHICDVCDRGGNDGRVPPELRAKIAASKRRRAGGAKEKAPRTRREKRAGARRKTG